MASAKVVVKPVTYDEGGKKLESQLVYDDSATNGVKRPGVLVFPEWWGLNDFAKSRAQELAQMGYVALAVDMYGNGQATTDAKQAKDWAGPLMSDKPAMARRAQAALTQLLNTKLVNPRQVAAIGFCFGGTCSQELAYSGAPIAAVVSFHGGLVTPSADQVKQTHAKFLMLNGAVDPTVKQDAVKDFMQALDAGKIDYEFINYAGARHAFTNPDADKLGAANGMSAVVGYNEIAARRSWAQMKMFFDEIFGRRSS